MASTKDRILREIRRVASEVAPNKLTQQDFIQRSNISINTVRYHFSTWNSAVSAAGLEPNPPSQPVSGYKRINDEDLLHEIGELWKRFGRRPTEDLMNSQGKYSTRPFKKRWGSFSAAVDRFVHEFGIPDINLGAQSNVSESKSEKDRAVLVPKTHKPKALDKKAKRQLFGEPIEFRGLRYAPINEQGVVYLFGMVSRELGFLIESVRTDFPDCEGKRCLDANGTKWEHVRIEFEYRSKNFFEQGHDPAQCDLIVCWIHDWEDCPLEVLELRSTIGQLPKA